MDRPPDTIESLGESLADALDEGVGSVVAALPLWVMEAPSGYPVQVTFEPPPANNRLWAVPLVGFLVKTVILIPHLMALAVLMTVATVSQLVFWIPVFDRGQYPD